MKSATSGTTASAPQATVSETARQPTCAASQASPGRKINCPVALPAVSTPRTMPRRSTNQRLTTVAASTVAIEPVPIPTTTPQRSTSCQGAVIWVVSKRTGGDRDQRGRDRPLEAPAVDHRRGERPHEAKEQEVDRDRERDRRPAPAKIVLQRDDQDPRSGPKPGCADQGHKGDPGHDPGVVDFFRTPNPPHRSVLHA